MPLAYAQRVWKQPVRPDRQSTGLYSWRERAGQSRWILLQSRRNIFVIVYLIYADVRLHLPMARNNDAGQHIVPHTWGWFNVLGTHDVAYRLNHNYWKVFLRERPIAILAMA